MTAEELLARRLPGSVDGVLALMHSLEQALRDGAGVRSFLTSTALQAREYAERSTGSWASRAGGCCGPSEPEGMGRAASPVST